MKVTNGEIWQAATALPEICKVVWPVKTAYGLVKLTRKVNEARKDIDVVRTELIRLHGTANERGQIEVTPEECPSWEFFAKSFNELMAEETEIDWGPVELPTDGYKVQADLLMAAGPFITVKDE